MIRPTMMGLRASEKIRYIEQTCGWKPQASCWYLVCWKAHGSKCIFDRERVTTRPATHTHTYTHSPRLLFKSEIILIWNLCVVQKSWQCVTYMKYVIPWISNDYCVKRNIKGTHMKHNMKCVEGQLWWRHPPHLCTCRFLSNHGCRYCILTLY